MENTKYNLIDEEPREKIRFDVSLTVTLDTSVLNAIRDAQDNQSLTDSWIIDRLGEEIYINASLYMDHLYNWRKGGDGESAKVIQSPIRCLVLVYQAGIANVFEVDDFETLSNRKRIKQSYFGYCEQFCLGAAAMGANVKSMGCNVAGDCIDGNWTDDLESLPFRDEQHPVNVIHE